MEFRIIRSFLLVVVASLGLFAGRADAAIVSFVPETTTNLMWTDLEEANNVPPLFMPGISLFGHVSSGPGDVLVLQSTAFSLDSTSPSNLLTGNFDATITAKPGHMITSITIKENGSAFAAGNGSTAYVFMESSVIPDGAPAMMGDDSYTLVGTGLPNSTQWSLAVGFSFAPASEVLFSLRNLLYVDGANGAAQIGKDKVVIEVGTQFVGAAIPEPTSGFAMLACGIAGVAVRRRRK